MAVGNIKADSHILLNYDSEDDDISPSNSYQKGAYLTNSEYQLKVHEIDVFLKNQEDPQTNKTHCKICNKKLKSDGDSKTHYASKSHYKAFLKRREEAIKQLQKTPVIENKALNQTQINFGVDVDKLDIPRVCVTPIRKLDTPVKKNKVKTSQVVLNSSVAIGPEKKYCPFCNIDYDLQQFKSHTSEFVHCTMESLKLQYSVDIVDAFCSIAKNGKQLFCNICQVIMSELGSVHSHLNGAKHFRKFKTFLDTFNSKKKTAVSKVKTIPSLIPENISTSAKPKEDYTFYCYLCKQLFINQTKLNIHTLDFPHVEMINWKSDAIVKGIPYVEYWNHSQTSLTCKLCKIVIRDVWDAKQHFMGVEHQKQLLKWSELVARLEPEKPDSMMYLKYFYCTTCCVTLSGTSTEWHYTTQEHLKYSETYIVENDEMAPVQTNNLPTQSQNNQPNELQEVFDKILLQLNYLYHDNEVPRNFTLRYFKELHSQMTAIQTMYKKRA